MSDPSSPMMENLVLGQCLDFSRQLISKQQFFKFEVKLPCGFTFNLNTLDQEPTQSSSKEVKKKSPSTLKRNAARKQRFLEEKNSSVRNKTSDSSFKCDQCDLEANCKVSLRKHIEKEHKIIPQIDGFDDDTSEKKESSETESVDVKQVEVQSEPATFEMGTDGYPKVTPMDPEVTPPKKVFHPDLGVGVNVVKTELWNATWWQYTFQNYRGSGEDFQRRIYVVKKTSL